MSTNSDAAIAASRRFIDQHMKLARQYRSEGGEAGVMWNVNEARRHSQAARHEIHKPGPKRYWCVMLHTGGQVGAHVTATDITYAVERDHPDGCRFTHAYWSHEPETVIEEIAGQLRMYLMADEEWEALEVATSGFCQAAGVRDVTMLLAWGNEQHRQWRARRDAEIAAAKMPARIEPQQIGLPI